MAAIDDLKEWFEVELRGASWDRNVKVDDSDPANIDVRFYTDVNEYNLTITQNDDGAVMDAWVIARKPRAGQPEARSRHLSRTPFNQRTWRRLLSAVVSTELVRIQRQDPLEGAEDPAAQRPAHAGARRRAGAGS